MTKRPVNRHWLRENAKAASPHRLLVVDTETHPVDPDGPEYQVMRLWSAKLVRRHDLEPDKPREEWFHGYTPESLADLVSGIAKRDRTTWLYCHNLSFDLAVTALPPLMTERGWRLTGGALTSDSPWCRFERKGARVTIADSWSWFPASLLTIGPMVGIEKVDLPDWSDSDEAWFERCDGDVDITAEALLQTMDWWDDGKHGNWSVTGPACGWGTYRHQRPTPQVLVDPSPAARAFENRAVFGGRRDVRRTGAMQTGLFANLDIATAHLTVMGNFALPSRRFSRFESLPLDHLHLRSSVFDVVAEVELNVKVPRYPWNSGRGVFYPTGRFRTVLAGPEIREAIARGELVSIGPGYSYQMRRHMQDWAIWVASLLDEERSDVPAVVRLLAKHWSRCVPGKWAGHTSDVVSKIADPRPGWAIERGAMANGKVPADFLRIGHELWTIARDEWADDAFPAILAFIQSHTRVAIGKLLDALGPSWITVNTDGAYVDLRKWWNDLKSGSTIDRATDRQIEQSFATWLIANAAEWSPFVPRIKELFRDLTVYGPQHVIVSGERRLSGIPRSAVKLADGRFTFTAWPKLRVQLQAEGPPRYRTQEQTASLAAIAPNGWLLNSGWVMPIRLLGEFDGPVIAPPDWVLGGTLGGLAPVERQHQRLRSTALLVDVAARSAGVEKPPPLAVWPLPTTPGPFELA